MKYSGTFKNNLKRNVKKRGERIKKEREKLFVKKRRIKKEIDIIIFNIIFIFRS